MTVSMLMSLKAGKHIVNGKKKKKETTSNDGEMEEKYILRIKVAIMHEFNLH